MMESSHKKDQASTDEAFTSPHQVLISNIIQKIGQYLLVMMFSANCCKCTVRRYDNIGHYNRQGL